MLSKKLVIMLISYHICIAEHMIVEGIQFKIDQIYMFALQISRFLGNLHNRIKITT